MSSHKQKRALSAHHSRNNTSHLLCAPVDSKRLQLSPEEGKGRRRREKQCVSVKNPSQVVSFEGSKASSVRKQKQKNKKKAVLVMSEHETPVLGKYFLASSNHPLPHTTHLHSISDQAAAEQLQPKLSPRGEGNSVRAPPSIKPQLVSSEILKAVAAEEVEARLDQTIDKLRSKQQTIQILNKTIQTRLVDAGAVRSCLSREDTYEVEMNFYVDKITLLQKQLYQKNRLLRAAQSKNDQFATLARNTKKLLRENSRLREQLELSVREVAALKKLLLKAEAKLA